jgi:Kef-type K+ transport system membrane component KefB
MSPATIGELTLILLAAVIAPLLVELLKRFAIPGVVLEIALGVLLGPQVLDLVRPVGVVSDFSNIGLALLMFLAGYEMDLPVVRGRPLRLAGAAWLMSLVGGFVIGLVLLIAGNGHDKVVIGLCVSTTALGTLLPVLRDSGLLKQPFGRYVLAAGSVGEFGPIVLVALLFGGSDPGWTLLLLAGFGVLAAGCAIAAGKPWGERITGGLRRGLHSSSQLPVRISMLLVISLVLLATHLDLDVLLGAFAAGIIVRVSVSGREDTSTTVIFQGKLEAIGFGLFVPIFFVVSGARLDLGAFGRHPVALVEIPVFLVLMLLVRGLPTLLCFRYALRNRQRAALAFFSATGLPLIVVVTAIALADGLVTTQTAAALVTAGMLSVLIFPVLGLRVLGSTAPAEPPPYSP